MEMQQLPRTLGFLIYREYQNGASVEDLAAALHAPTPWIEERIEAVRLCLEKQVRIELHPVPSPRRASAGRSGPLSIRSRNTRRSR